MKKYLKMCIVLLMASSITSVAFAGDAEDCYGYEFSGFCLTYPK